MFIVLTKYFFSVKMAELKHIWEFSFALEDNFLKKVLGFI